MNRIELNMGQVEQSLRRVLFLLVRDSLSDVIWVRAAVVLEGELSLVRFLSRPVDI